MPFNFLTTLTTIMIVTTNPKTVIPDMIIQDQNPFFRGMCRYQLVECM